MRHVVSLLPLLFLPACATIIEGTSQSVAISTNPAGAACQVDRNGTHLATVSPTPGSVHVDKSKNDLTITCAKDGYRPASISQSPKFVGTTFGNIVIGGLVGVVVDAASGANFTYPSDVRIDMAPVPPATASAPVANPFWSAPVSSLAVPTAKGTL